MKLKDTSSFGKVVTNPDSMLKCWDITLPTKVHLVKAVVFPVVMYGCESWTIKKAEHRIDAFELSCWRRLLRVPWSARRSNVSILKAISSEYLVEGLMPKLKVQYFGHLMWRTASFEKTLMLGKIKDGRRRAQQRMRRVDGITNSMDMSLSKLWEWVMNRKSGVLQSTGLQRVRHDWVTELNWASFLGIWMSSSPSTILGNTVFPPLNYLTTFVKNHLTLCVKVFLRSEFFSIDL